MALRSCGLNCLHGCRLAKPSLHVFSGHFFSSSAAAACLLLLFSGARVRWPQSGTYKEICVQKRPTKLKIEIQIGKKTYKLAQHWVDFIIWIDKANLISQIFPFGILQNCTIFFKVRWRSRKNLTDCTDKKYLILKILWAKRAMYFFK